MVSPAATTRRRAFTLLEMLVAMVVASLVMLLAAGAVRATTRGVGDTVTDTQQGAREERIRALLSAQLAWLQLDEARAPVRFNARADSLDLQTMCTLAAPHKRDQATARWRIARSAEDNTFTIYYAEASTRRRADRPDDEDGAEAERADAESVESEIDIKGARPLLRGLRGAKFECLASTGLNGEGAEWTDTWLGPGLPRALRLTIVTKEGASATWVIPVAVTF